MGDVSRIEREFEVFAEDCKGSSPLYEYLALQIANNDELLELSTYAQKGQPKPNMLLGSVHHLLLNGTSHPLASYYPNLVEETCDINGAFRHFLNFCRKYRREIIKLLQTKLVQTNEVRRCSYLFPIFTYIYEQVKQPLALIEIGTSAGFQLLWDKYSYSYTNTSNVIYGAQYSPVHITAHIKGEHVPYLRKTPPPVSDRIGLDLHINDVANREDYLWLLSLIWPEHDERRELFKQAANCMKEEDLQLIEGDGIKCLKHLAKDIPSSSAICVFHTHVANQFSEGQKRQLIHSVQTIGQSRPIFHIYNNMWDGDLHLDYIIEGKEYNHTVGQANSHGKWFTWQL